MSGVARVAPVRSPASNTSSSKHIRAGTRPVYSVPAPDFITCRRMCRGEARAAIMPQPHDIGMGSVRTDVLPKGSDRGVRTWVKARGITLGLAQFLVGRRSENTGNSALPQYVCYMSAIARTRSPEMRERQPGGPHTHMHRHAFSGRKTRLSCGVSMPGAYIDACRSVT
jgi:hypothetical protein